MKGSRNLHFWMHGRRNAPVAWLDAPTDDTYTFEVDCRLVLGSGTLISVVSVYDGPALLAPNMAGLRVVRPGVVFDTA